MQAAVVPAVTSSRQVKDVGNLSSDRIKCYTPILFGEMRIDQLRYLCQVMVIVLRNKIQMIHEPHGLLEPRMQARSRKNVRFKCPQMLH